jgi:hypothetical protein
MSNEVFKMSLPRLFTARGRASIRTKPAAKDQLTAAQEEAAFKAYLAGVWQSYSGMSTGGWGQPW